jgi:hypothetical protein
LWYSIERKVFICCKTHFTFVKDFCDFPWFTLTKSSCFVMDCKVYILVSWCWRRIEWLARQYFEIICILPSDIIFLLSYCKTIVTHYLFFRIPCQKWDRVHLHYLETWQRLVFSMLDPVLVSVTMTETVFFLFH